MRNQDVKYCKVTKKYCYSSEAKATRAMNRYDDIKRVYLCEHCNSWHTTSMSYKEALREGVIEPKSNKKPPSKKKIQKKLEYLN